MRHLSEVLGCFATRSLQKMRGKMADNLRKKGPGLLNGIEVIAVNHHRACNVAQPLTPGIDLLPRLRDRGCRTITAQACAAADRRRASRSDSSRWRKNQRAEEEETATLIPGFPAVQENIRQCLSAQR